MRDKHYPTRQFRISDENYKVLLSLKKDTWNLLFTQLLYGHDTNRSLFIKDNRTSGEYPTQTKEVKANKNRNLNNARVSKKIRK